MNKKWAILITAGVMAVVYLFLLVGVPALEDAVPACGSYDLGETANNSALYITANLTPIGPPLDLRPYKEAWKAPLLLYLVPGLVGLAAVVVILNQKKEAK